MPEPDQKPDLDLVDEVLGADLTSVEDHLERRFPDADSDDIQGALEDAAEDLAGARITTFRSLLIEHKASDTLRDDAQQSDAVLAGTDRGKAEDLGEDGS
jgi:hypothetical protein